MPKGEYTSIRARRISGHYREKARQAVEQATEGLLVIPGNAQLLLRSDLGRKERLDRADTCFARAQRALNIYRRELKEAATVSDSAQRVLGLK